ncbi:MAG TPA: hypothetical protein VMG12_38425 [Polyangiaceae bacterium]|nr:hypothetical protein [Polyangiaceae bacterium]
MRFSLLGVPALALGLIAGCDDDGGGPWPPVGGGGSSAGLGNGGGAGADERGGSAGEGGGDGGPATEDLSELRALEACDVPEPCGESFAQLIEGMTHNIRKDGASCVLRSLADRRPGRYTHRTESTYGNGSTAVLHVFVVAADGSVAYVRDPTRYTSSPESGSEVLPPDPAQRCTLKPASYFEQCLAAVEAAVPNSNSSADPAWPCTYGDGVFAQPSRLDWFESCTPEAPPRCASGSAPVDAGGDDAGGVDGGPTDAASP